MKPALKSGNMLENKKGPRGSVDSTVHVPMCRFFRRPKKRQLIVVTNFRPVITPPITSEILDCDIFTSHQPIMAQVFIQCLPNLLVCVAE